MPASESSLTKFGYSLHRISQQKYRGLVPSNHLIATADGVEYFALEVPDYKPNYARLVTVQNQIRHMAQICLPSPEWLLSRRARGANLWDLDTISASSREMIATKLIEFAHDTKRAGVIHADLRPWNVFVDNSGGIEVIDWNLMCFADEIATRPDLMTGHYKNFNPGLLPDRILDIDMADAQRMARLLKGDIRFEEAWNQSPPGYPAWCNV